MLGAALGWLGAELGWLGAAPAELVLLQPVSRTIAAMIAATTARTARCRAARVGAEMGVPFVQ